MAEVEGEWLTAVRTAASTAVATDVLARRNVRVLGVFGSGREAMTHIAALMLVRKFDKVLVYSRDAQRREAFAKKMSNDCRVKVVAAASPDIGASESDVIVTATTSNTPVFDGNMVKVGSHVNAIGNGVPESREVDSNLVKRCRLVVDSRAQAFSTYGDVIIPVREGVIHESDVLELGELLIGKSKVGKGPDDVTLSKAGGLAVLDAMVTDHLVRLLSRKNGSAVGSA